MFGVVVFILLLKSFVKAQDCTLAVPSNPLTATGLATPYQLSGCDQRQFSDQGTFVEAAIFDPATNSISIYHPLVINKGDVVGKDYIQPVPATVPAGATVGLWFGTNAASLTLTGDTATCVNGLGNSIFGQFASCNGAQFMTTALAAVSSGALSPPPLGTGKAGVCATTRDFRIVDMDQSDNVVTTYLLINNHTLSQSTPAASKNNADAQVLSNGSDNALLDVFIDPITGCMPWTAKSPTTPTGTSSALSLNELVASKFQQNPALVPVNDPMVVITDNAGNIQQSLPKVNLYRAAVGQPAANSVTDASGITYCTQFAAAGIWIAQNKALFQGGTSPAPATATNLYTFLAQRFAASFGPVPALGCQTIFGMQNSPVSMTMDGNGVVTAATINTNVLQQILSGQIKPGSTMISSSVTSTAATGTTTATAASSATGATTVKSSLASKFTGRFSHQPFTFSRGVSSFAIPTTAVVTSNVAATTTAATTTAASAATSPVATTAATSANARPTGFWGGPWWRNRGSHDWPWF